MPTAPEYSNPASGPATNAAAVTPADGTDLPDGIARALYIGGAGDVSLVTNGGSTVTFVALVAGTILPVLVKRVRSTGTTATDLVALY